MSVSLVLAEVIAGCGQSHRAEEQQASRSVTVWSIDDGTDAGGLMMWSCGEANPSVAPAVWQVIDDPTAPSGGKVMALTRTDNRGQTYNITTAVNRSYRDLRLTVQVKGISGKEDQGGGPIWRCRDPLNYYICRFNPLEDNFRLYYVKDGKRRQLASADVDTEAGRWYEVGVTMVGSHIICSLDGRKLLEVKDNTFAAPGMVGLWTKADAVTSFDSMSVR